MHRTRFLLCGLAAGFWTLAGAIEPTLGSGRARADDRPAETAV
jgi:hypothetical protein